MIKKNNQKFSFAKGATKIGVIIKAGQLIYQAIKKILLSGIPPLILEKSASKDLVDYNIYGKSEQGNIFNPEDANYIIGYFTRAVTTITTHANARTLYLPCLPNTTYAANRNISFAQFHLGYTEELPSVGSTVYGGVTADNTTVTTLETTTGENAQYLVIYCYNGYVTTDVWDDIINSIEVLQIPTPDAPIEIESVGDKTINLINPNAVDGTNRYIVAATGYPYAPSSGNWRYSGYIEVEGGKEYNFNAINSNATTAGMAWYDSTQTYISGVNTTTINNNNGVLTAPDNAKYARVSWKIDEGYNPDWQNTVQVSEGSESKPFEPYGKYKIPVKARGKNIYNPAIDTRFDLQEDGSYLSNTYITQQTYLMTNLKGVYSISVQISSPVGTNYRIRVFYTDGTYTDSYKVSTGEYVQIQFKTNGKDIARIVWYYSSTSNQVRFKNFQIETGDVVTKYEPYKEPTYSTIYLDEPLRKIGDYAEYIDFEKKKVIRYIYNEYVDTVTAVSGNFYSYWVFLSNITKKPLVTNEGNTTTSKGWCMSNKFQLSREYYQNLSKNPNLIQPYITTGGINRVAYTFDNASIDTVEEAQEKIGDGFEISYVLETPIEETMELPNIPTHKGTNIIEVDTTINPSNMEVVYYKK